MTATESDTSTQPRSATGFGCFTCRWWLQQLGGQQQRGQLFGTLTTVGVAAAVVAGDDGLCMDEAELRFGDLGRYGRSCLQRVMLPKRSGGMGP